MKKLFVLALLFSGVTGFVISPWIQGQSAAPAVTKGKDLVSYRDVVKKVLPSVVSIEAKAKPMRLKEQGPKRKNQGQDNPQIPEEFRKFFEEFKKRGGEDGPDDSQGGFGSGFIVESNGIIVTNNHVVEGSDKVEITLNDGRKFTSTEIKGDPKTDLAIVKIDAKNLPALEFGDSDASEIGDRVLALGAPFGLTGSVTSGIISAKGRSLRLNFYEDFHCQTMFQCVH
jgi:serine protease Do